MARHWACNIVGHRYDPEADAFGVTQCLRCGASDYYGPEIDLNQPWHIRAIEGLRWLWFPGLRRRLRRLGEWLKCPDCGGRFGRHDADRCLPF